MLKQEWKCTYCYFFHFLTEVSLKLDTLGDYTNKRFSEWRFQGLGISEKLMWSNMTLEQNKQGGSLASPAVCTEKDKKK